MSGLVRSMTHIDTLQKRVAKLEKRVKANARKKGVAVHQYLYERAVNELVKAQNEEARNG